MYKITNLIKTILSISLVAIIMPLMAINGQAAAVAVTPVSANDSLATPIHSINMTTCVEVFNWEKFNADRLNGITNSNPYDKQGCLRQENFASNGTKNVTKDSSGKITSVSYNVGQTKVNATKYADFNGNANTTAKAAIGNTPVLGVVPNGNVTAQALSVYGTTGNLIQAGSNVDRSQLSSLDNIYTQDELNKLYGPQTARTGAPRAFSTGKDKLLPNNKYSGNYCYTENGKMKVRTKILVGTPNEITVSQAQFGDPSNPFSSCRWIQANGSTDTKPVYNCETSNVDSKGITETALDCSLEIYQALYIFRLPTSEQCRTLFNILPANYETGCLKFFQNTNTTPITGQQGAKGVIYTYTYYGMYADGSFICQNDNQPNCLDNLRWGPDGNWKNPDINGPRKSFSTQASEQELRSVYPNDTNLSYQQLKDKFNGLVRGLDGYSAYPIN